MGPPTANAASNASRPSRINVCNPVSQHLYPSLGFREVARQIRYVMALEQG